MRALTRRLKRLEESRELRAMQRRLDNIVTQEEVDYVVGLGCEAHVEPDEVGRLSHEDWIVRFTDGELEVIAAQST